MKAESLSNNVNRPTPTDPGAGAPGPPAPGRSVPGSPIGERYLTEFAPLFGHSAKMRAIREILEEVAPTSATVLIRGESGVGKEVVARAIAYASRRPIEAFVKVNCAALPAELLESELFGHERGAFTGAYRRKLGKFEFANKGTMFLDEIGELPLALQAKLLNVLQDGEFSRVGGREIIRVDTRIIASTNRDLVTAINRGEFREDLYYRLNVVEIEAPPLRERREEIPVLTEYFLEKFNQQAHRRVTLLPGVMEFFVRYDWPGNVRQLENIVRRLVVLGNVPGIHQEVLNTLRGAPTRPAQCGPGSPDEHAMVPAAPSAEMQALGLRAIARRAAREAERRALQQVLEEVRWNRIEAARLLKVSYKTLLTKISECGLGSKSSPLGSSGS
jgi:two-component system response regulator AtoC